MSGGNSSLAKDFDIYSEHFGRKNATFNFIVNINTSAHLSSPYFSHVTSIQVSLDTIFIAVKTSSTIAILKAQSSKISLLHQLESNKFDDMSLRQSITTFEFLPFHVDRPDAKNQMLIAYSSGLIAIIDYMSQSIITFFNYDEKKREVFKKASIIKILFHPTNPFLFYALFQDSTMIGYDLSSVNLGNNPANTNLNTGVSTGSGKKASIIALPWSDGNYNKDLIRKIAKIETAFQDMKAQVEKPSKPKKKGAVSKEDQGYKTLYYFRSDAPETNFIRVVNTDKARCNPTVYYKFNCATITDAQFTHNSFFSSLKNEKLKNTKKHYLLPSLFFCFTGFDGFFRIFDFLENLPLLSFRSYYGGFNSFCLSSNLELVALSCQDDTIILFDLDNFKYVCLSGHRSFTTRAIFHEFNPYVYRLVAASTDSHISISEFDRGLLLQWDDEEKRVVFGETKGCSEEPTFRKIVFDHKEAIQIEVQNLIKVNQEGIGWLDIIGKILICSCFDGCVTAWEINDKITKLTKRQSITIHKEKTKEKKR